MNDELQETTRVTELELREEVDLANVKAADALRKVEAMKDKIVDYDATISKFRELVAHLQVRDGINWTAKLYNKVFKKNIIK